MLLTPAFVWQNRLVSFYPKEIAMAAADPRRSTRDLEPDAEGAAASFECGSFVRFRLLIKGGDSTIAADFISNGCGFMVAAAQTICEWLSGKCLGDLHGLDRGELTEIVFAKLGAYPQERVQCCGVAIEAVTAAFAAYRSKRLEEFTGEKALVCSCFGVSEETVEHLVRAGQLTEVSQVSDACNAGSGCGSCRMLIQEIIDSVGRKADML